MPMYEVRCHEGHEDEQFAHREAELDPCRVCGDPVQRVYRTMAHMRQDSIPGGMVINDLDPKGPMRFDSWSDYRRELKARGLVNKVEHVCIEGTDKAKYTSRWI